MLLFHLLKVRFKDEWTTLNTDLEANWRRPGWRRLRSQKGGRDFPESRCPHTPGAQFNFHRLGSVHLTGSVKTIFVSNCCKSRPTHGHSLSPLLRSFQHWGQSDAPEPALAPRCAKRTDRLFCRNDSLYSRAEMTPCIVVQKWLPV